MNQPHHCVSLSCVFHPIHILRGQTTTRRPGPQSSSLLASLWKSIGLSHSYEMSAFFSRSSGDPRPDGGELFQGLLQSHGLRRGSILELLSKRSVVPRQNPFILLALSFKGEERSALLAMKMGHF